MEKHRSPEPIRLRPRLAAALQLVGRAGTVADIGCDHGHLSAALLESGAASHVIAVDISAASVEKTRKLAARTGLPIEARQGDGLSALGEGEAQTIVIAGLGGTLMARLLDTAKPPLRGADRLVLQPACAVGDIRRYLRQNGYRIERDVIVFDAGRYYQAFSAALGEEDAWPAGWPEDCCAMGPKSIGEPLFLPLASKLLNGHEKRLIKARGTAGEAPLLERARAMRAVKGLKSEESICE